MAKKFDDLIAQLPEERQQKIREGTQTLLAEMPLHDLRRARELSKEPLAGPRATKQSALPTPDRARDARPPTPARWSRCFRRPR